MPGQGAAEAVRLGPGPGRRPGTLPGGQADQGSADAVLGARDQVDQEASRPRNGHDRQRRGGDRQIAMTTSKSAEVIFQAQEDMAQHQLDQARTRLLGLLPKIEGEPRLRDLHARARSLLTQIDSRIDDDRQREQDGKRYQQFLRKWNETQFHETQFTGLDVAANRKLIQQSARDALAVFTAPGSGETWSLG